MVNPPAPTEDIPTLSEWGIIILGIILLITGIVALGTSKDEMESKL